MSELFIFFGFIITLLIMIKKRDRIGFKGGFNLLDAYPMRFCNIIEKIFSDDIQGTFGFNVQDKNVAHVVVNLCPTESWSLPNWVVLEHKTTVFLDKIKEIKERLFNNATFYLAINKKESEYVVEAENYTKTIEWMKVFPLEPKYPQDDPVILAKVILRVNLDFYQKTTSHGILILDAQTVLAIYESYIHGNEVDFRFVALSGSGIKENEIVHVQVGTSTEKLLINKIRDGIKYRVFINGPLRGKEIVDFSQNTDWSVNNIVVLKEQDIKDAFPMFKSEELRFTTNILGETRRCVYCNFCDDICPVGLEPALYYHSHKRGIINTSLYNMEKCIECGLCSFICPSKLEILKIIKECRSTQ